MERAGSASVDTDGLTLFGTISTSPDPAIDPVVPQTELSAEAQEHEIINLPQTALSPKWDVHPVNSSTPPANLKPRRQSPHTKLTYGLE